MADLRNPPADVAHTHESFSKEAVYDDKGDVIDHIAYDDGPQTVVETKGDPFPIDPHAPIEDYALTVRAIVVGCCLGSVVGASNIYLGLKTG